MSLENSVPYAILAVVALVAMRRYAHVAHMGLDSQSENRIMLGEKGVPLTLETDPYEAQMSRERSKRRRSHAWSVLTGMVVVLFLKRAYDGYSPLCINRVQPPPGSDPFQFDWETIKPSTQFDFVRCYATNYCTRLDVPLDWNSTDPDGGPRAAIAVIKQPARVEVTDPKYAGVILTNPGGPGGSGVMFHVIVGEQLRVIIESELDSLPEDELKYYDIMSFDPRGVGATTPQVHGLDDPVSMITWLDQKIAIGSSMKDREIFDRVWAREKLYGRVISDATRKSADADGAADGGYVTTAIVVRDMVEIIEAHGIWRQTRADHLLQGRWGEDARKAKERTRWTPGEEPLNYYGISYGTVLGQEFATLQPHRIGRVILDGVVDAQDYTEGNWAKNLNDFDAITAKFAQHCVDAGEDCPISSWGGPHKDTVLFVSRVNSLITDLKEDPIAFIDTHSDSSYPSVATYSDVIMSIFLMWYSAANSFLPAAHLLLEISQRDGSSLWWQHPRLSCSLPSTPIPDPLARGIAIRCTDAGGQTNMTKANFDPVFEHLKTQSLIFSDYWATLRLPCHGYALPEPNGKPIWRFDGPFGAKTKNPILFASSALDPVTPLGNAEHASEKLFPGSGLLVVTDGIGHSSLSWPSTCAAKTVSKYFLTGEVGDGRINCQGDVEPFGANGLKVNEAVHVEAVSAVQGIKREMDRMGLGLGQPGAGYGLRAQM